MDTVKPVENKKNIDKYIFKNGSSEKLVSCCFITILVIKMSFPHSQHEQYNTINSWLDVLLLLRIGS